MRIKQLVVASACSLNTVAFAADRYVTPGGPGTDGAISWATAFPTLHDALVSDFTQPGDILYLGQGTYSPNGTDTSATFLVTDAGLTIKGGYLGGIGNPGTPGVRDINAYPTILTGLLPNEIRCKHVITVNDLGIADPTGAQILIEGVTIRDGQAGQPPPVEGTPDESVRGGGATVLESSVAFVKCKFLNNAALWDGGGLHVYDRPDQGGPDPWIMRSDVVNCLFEDCLATHGGGMANAEGKVHLVNVIFRNCDAIQQHSSLPVGNGGGFYNYRPDGAGITTEATLDSCTFHLNTSDQAGSLASVDGSTIKASNSLFWDGNPSVSVGGSTDVFRYCSSGNALPGNDHNDTNNPLLNADSTLTCGSLAINSGKRELLPSDDFDLDNSGNPPGHYEELPLDFALQQRVVVEVDRGAMELPRPPCLSDISGNGVVDVDDLIAVINNWGCGQPIVPCPADINGPCPNQGDGLVDVNDLLLVINYWDTNCGSGSTGEGLPQSYTDCSNLCAQYSGQAWADCMQACFKILCEQGQTEYCED